MVIADAVKVQFLDKSVLDWVGPKPNYKCPYKRQKKERTFRDQDSGRWGMEPIFPPNLLKELALTGS